MATCRLPLRGAWARRILRARLAPVGLLVIAAWLAATSSPVAAQDNYEIQVYPYETVKPGATMLELHSNYTAIGRSEPLNGVAPTNHAVHETVEITHGWNDWFETGFYIFTSARSGQGWDWVGDHIRPRVRAPEAWKWPVGVSISTEFGYQRPLYSEDTWTLEIRPIIDKQLGPWYLSFNPTLDRSWHGPGVGKGVEFSPNFKFSYDVTTKIAAGLEYYGSYGNLSGFDPFREQQQDFFPSIDLNVSPKWEFNFGVGVGVTRSTDHLIVKCIVGRRFSFGRHKQ